jgi:hypothetical protein
MNVRCILLQTVRSSGSGGGGGSSGAARQDWLVADDSGAVLLTAFGHYAAPGALQAGDIIELKGANTLMRSGSLRLATARADGIGGGSGKSGDADAAPLLRVGAVEMQFVEEPNMSAVEWVQSAKQVWTFKQPRESPKHKPKR